MTVGSLFAGIGGFDLGFERAGFDIKWQVEIDPFCRAVLAKHWPHVRRYEDVRTVGAELERVDVICGGFPCQDISESGRRLGIDGPRSSLWRQMLRIIGVLRPRFVVVENVSALLFRGLGRVLGDLSDIGYDAEWTTLSACRFGAPHTRERVFVVAYPHAGIGRAPWADQEESASARLSVDGTREKGRLSAWFATEPPVGSMVYGLSDAVDRLRPFGNAIVPQEAEWIAWRIKEADELDGGGDLADVPPRPKS